jgi:pimeloyl-ACP methyl ester carboxylesterase
MKSLGRTAISLLALAVALTAFMVFVVVPYDRDISEARTRVAAGGKVAKTRCGLIQYAETGEGAPLLVIHGAGGGFDQGLDFVESLAGKGFHVIAVSRFGYLGTPLPADASAPAQARAHACLLDTLGIRGAAIFGGSAGAPSAMQFAILYPERTTHLVLLVPAAYVPRPDGAPPMKTPDGAQFVFNTALKSDFIFWAMLHGARNMAIGSILGTPPELVEAASAAEKARVDKILDHILPVAPRRVGLMNDATVVSTLPRYELDRITAPTLVLSALDDRYGTFDGGRYTAQNIKGARFVGYPNGGHLLVGHEAEASAEIAAFLKK